MDTLLQNLRSALQTLSGHPAFTVAAAMSLGLSLQNGPARRLPERRTVRAARVVAPAPHRSPSWMDYIDFRRGSGDVLRWIAPIALSDQPERPEHPHTCGGGA